MWIYSQDKQMLINCNDVQCSDNEIITETIFRTVAVLGQYETIERCIEILNDIIYKINNQKFKEVYEMPEE